MTTMLTDEAATTLCDDFMDQGYIIIKRCIATALLDQAKQILTEKIYKQFKLKDNLVPGLLQAQSLMDPYDLRVMLQKELEYFDIPEQLLLSPALLKMLIHLLGPDLERQLKLELLVNAGGGNDFFIKKWHQEYWSGSGIFMLQVWTPIHMPEVAYGLELIPGSHKWGHIPHENRQPLHIPEDAQPVSMDIAEGDTAIIHALCLHRTLATAGDTVRVATLNPVRNIYHEKAGFEHLRCYHPFHFSPLSKIQKMLGNPHLSAFRLRGSQRNP